MRSDIHDLAGMKFGRLTVLGLSGRRGQRNRRYWLCRCECGNQKEALAGALKNAHVTSCGCAHATQGNKTGGRGTNHPLWHRWRGMISRCTYECSFNWDNYGGRGIKVCDRWKRFPNFLEDMEPTYTEGATLERVNNDGDYEPSNVIWATRAVQSRNKRSNRYLETPWGRITLLEASRKIGIRHATLRERIDRWPQDKWFTPPNPAKSRQFSRMTDLSKQSQIQLDSSPSIQPQEEPQTSVHQCE